MKALSLTQPWASLVAIGAKRIETRSWPTKYRGEIAIHASKVFPREAMELCIAEPFLSSLRSALPDRFDAQFGLPFEHGCELPRGAVVAVATLLEVLLTGDFLNYRHRERTIRLAGGRTWTITPTEIALGDYTPGRFAWLLDDVRPLREPIPCKGALRLWTVPPDVEAQIREELR